MSYLPKNIKKTRQREKIFTILSAQKKPLSVKEIYAQVSNGGDAICLSTLYRILEFFVKNGIALKSNSLNNEMAVYELNRVNHRHYAVCVDCQKVITINTCPMEKDIPKLKDDKFQVIGHSLEFFGYCKDCLR